MAAAGARFAEQVAEALKTPNAVARGAADALALMQDPNPNSRARRTIPTLDDGLPLNLLDYAFVDNPLANKAFGTEFFASGIVLGPQGVAGIHPTWQSGSSAEQKLVADMVGDLKSQIQKGQEWARNELANPSSTPPPTPKA